MNPITEIQKLQNYLRIKDFKKVVFKSENNFAYITFHHLLVFN